MKEIHRENIECKVCGDKFDETFKLEVHLKEHDVETFKCELCDKTFHLKWRLNKHIQAHAMLNVKTCHYFNNGKLCPFDAVGCMFKHEKSDECRFLQNCKNKLCPFQHPLNEETMDTSEDNQTNVSVDTLNIANRVNAENLTKNSNVDDLDDDSECEVEEEDLQCELCGRISDNFDEYLDHKGENICVNYCNFCDESFQLEDKEGLKTHTEKHCVKCEKLFSTKKLLKSHTNKCTVSLDH